MKPNRFFARAFAAASVSFAVSFNAAGQITGTALVRHAPSLNGTVEGSLQQMLPEGSTLNGGAVVTGDLLAPGTPTVRLNGNVTFGGSVDGSGASAPSNYQITLNGSARLGRVVRRTNSIPLPIVNPPPQPAGTRDVVITTAAQGAGDFSTLRNLTLNGGVGQFAIPPGAYGEFVANGGSGYTLGVAGASQPAVYSFQRLTLNGQTQIQVVGPVILNVAYGVTANGVFGSSANPAWLMVNVYSAGFTLNGSGTLHGIVNAPNGTVTLNGNSQLIGGVACNRLTVAGGGVLRLIAGTAGNRAPSAGDIAVSLPEDTSAGITLTASDPDGDTLAFTPLTSPLHGTLTGVAPTFTYAPAANFSGTDSFTFKAGDGQADSNVATVQITVIPVNDRPTADPKLLTVVEDTAGTVILSGADLDGDPLTFTVASQPEHGSLTTSGNNRVYTPASNYHGADSFSYTVNDGSLTSSTATVSITITPANDAPVAHGASYSVNEAQSVNMMLSGSDVDGNPLTFQQLSPPSNGTLTGTIPTLTYRPNTNFGGTDSFAFRVSDGQAFSAPATITISVTDLNFAPVALAGSTVIDEDTVTTLTLRATDQDGHALSYAIVTPPQNGTLGAIIPVAGNLATVVYAPNANFNGADTFAFRARDTEFADSNVATMNVTMRPVNDPPVAASQSVQTDEDTAVTVVLTGSDIENSTLTYSIITPAANGTLGPVVPGPNNTATVIYSPAANYHGPDTFTFKASDGAADSSAATVSLTVRPINDHPVVIAQTLTTNEDTSVTITLAATDVEGTALTFAIVTPPTNGSLSAIALVSPNTATLSYMPNANFNGADNFSFKASDGDRDSLPAVIGLAVSAQNDAPVATGQSFVQVQDTPFNFTLAATDPDGDALSYTIVSAPARGALSGTAPNLTYTPQLNDRSTVALIFTASDGIATSNQATVTFTMTVSNNAPVAAAVPPITIDEDTSTTVALLATDSDGDLLTFHIVTQPAHGSLAAIVPGLNNTATVIYTPTLNYHGSDSFAFKANDNPRDSNVVTVSITVRPINDAPTASNSSATTLEDVPVTIALTATDNDNDPLAYILVTQPASGLLTLNGANAVYTPPANFSGNDSFTWKARDTVGTDSNTATVSIIVAPVNDAPVAANKSVETAEDVSVPVMLTATDLDDTSLTFTVVTPPAKGTLIGLAPNLTYKPAANDSGTYAFTYKANDGDVDSAIATVTIVVRPINDPPIANPLTISTGSGSPTAITLTGSDVDSPTLTFAIATPPQNGTISGAPPNVTYTSAANFGGFDSFTFTANDGALNSAPATIQITTGLPPRSRTYTTTADFTAGVLTGISTSVPDQLSNKTILAAYDVVWVANSSKGTVVKLEPETGRVTGEFLTTPDPNVTPYP
ncbi:MAG: Ig-like domain-containing protein, partial [Opitutaceae bacterium]